MLEHRSHPLLPRRLFIARTLRYGAFSGLLLSVSLLLGMIGYHFLAGIGWIDAFYNAAMILTGMGPALDLNSVPPGQQNSVKIFAGLYALYSGVIFLAASGLVLTPILHRWFHQFHLDIKN